MISKQVQQHHRLSDFQRKLSVPIYPNITLQKRAVICSKSHEWALHLRLMVDTSLRSFVVFRWNFILINSSSKLVTILTSHTYLDLLTFLPFSVVITVSCILLPASQCTFFWPKYIFRLDSFSEELLMIDFVETCLEISLFYLNYLKII